MLGGLTVLAYVRFAVALAAAIDWFRLSREGLL